MYLNENRSTPSVSKKRKEKKGVSMHVEDKKQKLNEEIEEKILD